MIKIYTVDYSLSCQKAVEWLKNRGIQYEEINILKKGMSKEELVHILSLTENGVGDIIAKRSKAYQELAVRLDDLPLSALIQLIQRNSTLLRSPLIVDDNRLQIGYNEDEIRKFLPREFRDLVCETLENNIRLESLSHGIS